MKIKKIKFEQVILIISLAVAFSLGNLWQVIASITIIAYILLSKKHYGNLTKKDIKRLLKWFLVPCIIVHLYTLLFAAIGIFEFQVLSTNLITYLPVIVAILIVYQHGISGCIDVLIAILLAFFITFIQKLTTYGFSAVVSAMTSFLSIVDNSGGSIFELDDIVQAAGYFIIIFLNSSFLNKRNSFLIALTYFFIFVMGGKRICVVAVAITTFTFLVLKKMKPAIQKKTCIIIGYGIVALGIILIFELSTPEFLELLMGKYGLNLMSRNYFWNGIMKITSFSPDFIGYGRGYVKLWMPNHFPPFQNVHCDYIKMFVEIGLIPYIIWLLYYAVILPQKVWKKYGNKVGLILFLTTIFTFILYLTDNTESYYICGLVRTIIPIALISSEKTGF